MNPRLFRFMIGLHYLVERHLVAVAIDKDNALRRLAHQLLGKRIGVIMLAVIKYLLLRKIAAIHRFENRARARVSSAIPGGSALSGWPVERASAGG